MFGCKITLGQADELLLYIVNMSVAYTLKKAIS